MIALIVAGSAGAFAYTAGWLSPERLTPTKLVAALAPPVGPALGHRRNHAKGVCFTGEFQSNGNGASLSRAQVFTSGTWPVLGRFNLATPNPNAADATVRVRGMGLQITTPNGDVWRSAMIDAPVFAVSTPEVFYELLQTAPKGGEAMKAFIGRHPEFLTFAGWAGTAPWTSSYAEDPFNSLNSFLFTDVGGTSRAVRWSLRPAATPVPIAPDELAKKGPNYLEREIASRVATAPQRWTMVVTVAESGDDTADPSKAWPAGRRTVEVGTLVVKRVEAEPDGPCRDINFDPTVLPRGMSVSDDPFPAARSSAYARSYDLRTSEAKDYPRTTATGSAKP
ncbi:catalase family peroxidase [Reyranella sp.]|uniref:catalase family peroxidase n=1 Tax=Reyranella sp. TaxID=1929291 RepID=UPI003D129AD7